QGRKQAAWTWTGAPACRTGSRKRDRRLQSRHCLAHPNPRRTRGACLLNRAGTIEQDSRLTKLDTDENCASATKLYPFSNHRVAMPHMQQADEVDGDRTKRSQC